MRVYRWAIGEVIVWELVILLALWSQPSLMFGQSSQDQVGFTAVPPSRVEPKTPLSVITSTFEDPAFLEMAMQEETRFKLLNNKFSTLTWAEQYQQKQLMDNYSERVSKLFVNAVKDNLQETVIDALEDSPFSQIIDLAKSAKKITRALPDQGSRRIAMSFSPNPQEPAVNISNIGLLDDFRVTYNVYHQSPAFSMERKINSGLTSQVYYHMLFQTLDSALKQNITKDVHLHIINRNQFAQNREKSIILGVSIDIH